VSRRRKLPPPNPACVPFNAAVVCTDRGQHPEALIARFVDEQDPGAGRGIVWQQTPHEDLVADVRPDRSQTFRFACKRCGRDVRLREPSVLAAIDALRQAGESHKRLILNISLLP
jgi:hypothetical protein